MTTANRRQFMVGVGTAAAVGLPGHPAASATGPGSDAAALTYQGPELVDANGTVDWEAVRAEFRLDPRWAHFGLFLIASHPRPVREAIEFYQRKIDADPLWADEQLFTPGQDIRTGIKAVLADYIGGRAEEISLMPSTTIGLAMFFAGLRIRPGQELLTTEHDFYSLHESARRAAEKNDATVRFVRLYDDPAKASGAQMVERLRRSIRPKTRAVAVTWVHSSTGVRLPLAPIVDAVAEANQGRAESDRCLLLVDAVHGLGVDDVAAARWGADFVVAGTHKWLFTPRGTGMLWGKAELWPHLHPTIPTFEFTPEVDEAWLKRRPLPPTRASYVSPGGTFAYEYQFAMPAGIAFHRRIGPHRIKARIHQLSDHARTELARMPGVTLRTPLDPALASGLVCFEVAGMTPAQVVARLAERRIRATATPYLPSYARIGTGIMNSPAEVDRFLRAVRDLRP
ncbi:aminotransferase class V-fold PLP-dependent enzyme [Actinomadura fulvescens]